MIALSRFLKSRRGMSISTLVSTMFLALCMISIPAAATIVGSSHDFSAEGWAVNGEICNVCHTPHDADLTAVGAPLWDHEVTVGQTYQLYTSDTLHATLAQPDHYSSRLCLSCHDGTVAKDSFGGATGTEFMVSTDLGFIGLDLRGEHPIDFTYDDALATDDGGLFAPSTALSGLGGTIQEDLLFSDTLGCASCHDVHNTDGIASMLRKSNTGSDFCMTCHDK